MKKMLILFLVLVPVLFSSILLAQTREEILRALQSKQTNVQEKVMISALQSPDPIIQEYSIQIWMEWPLTLQIKFIGAVCDFYLATIPIEDSRDKILGNPYQTSQTRRQILQVLGKSPDLCLPESCELVRKVLQRQIRQEDENLEQYEAIWLLIRWNKKGDFVQDDLISLYPNVHTELQELILQKLAQNPPGYEKIATIIEEGLSSKSEGIRWQCAYIIGQTAPKGSASAVALLCSNLLGDENSSHGDTTTVIRIIEALGKIAPPNDTKVNECIWNFRQHPDPFVRISTAESLLKISQGKKIEGIKILAKEMGHTQASIRLSSATAILPYDPNPGKSWMVFLQAAKSLPKEAIQAITHLAHKGVVNESAIEFLQQQYRQNSSEKMNVLSALWQTHRTSGQPRLAYFRELLMIERDPFARAYIQQILQYGK